MGGQKNARPNWYRATATAKARQVLKAMLNRAQRQLDSRAMVTMVTKQGA